MEWQIRNWLFTGWCSGDHIVEQHVHNLDVMNWAFGAHPVKCVGMGGRAARTEPQYGNIYDHFAVEYEYPNGARVLSMCRQTAGAAENVSERVVGATGFSYTDSADGYIKGAKPYENPKASPNPYVEEHKDLIASIKAGKPLNEGRQVAESCLTAIMGRMSAYTGRALSWDWVMNASKLDLTPPHMEFKGASAPRGPGPGQDAARLATKRPPCRRRRANACPALYSRHATGGARMSDSSTTNRSTLNRRQLLRLSSAAGVGAVLPASAAALARGPAATAPATPGACSTPRSGRREHAVRQGARLRRGRRAHLQGRAVRRHDRAARTAGCRRSRPRPGTTSTPR